MRSQKTKEAFIKYLNENPNFRFWQAVRNFSPFAFIYGSNEKPFPLPKEPKIIDTFYEEENFEESNEP